MRIRTARDLGIVIRERRRALGLNQHTLATQVGVSRQWLIDAEKGKPTAEVGLLFRTLNALGLHLQVEGDDAPPPEETGASRDRPVRRHRAHPGEAHVTADRAGIRKAIRENPK